MERKVRFRNDSWRPSGRKVPPVLGTPSLDYEKKVCLDPWEDVAGTKTKKMAALDSKARQLLNSALERLAPRLSDIYRGALAVLVSTENPDRFAQAAHSLRELMEKLPQWLWKGGKISVYSLKVEVRNLLTKWNQVELVKAGEHAKVWRRFAQDFERFRQEFEGSRPTRANLVRSSLRSLEQMSYGLPVPIEDRRVRVWKDLSGYFTRVAHHSEVDELRFQERLNTLEEHLLDQLHPRTFEDHAAIDDLVTEAREGVTEELVRRLLTAVKREADYRYFFSRLDDPAWIRPLREAGFFRRYRPRSGRNDRTLVYWPESQFLSRIARKAPELVASTIKGIEEPITGAILLDLASAALEMPGKNAAELLPKLIEGVADDTEKLNARILGEVIAHLIEEGELKAGVELLGVVVELRVNQRTLTEGMPTAFDIESRLPDWDLEQVLKEHIPGIASAAGLPVLEVLCGRLNGLLEEWSALSGIDAPHDMLTQWRPAIEDHEQNFVSNSVDHVVSAIRDIATTIVDANPEDCDGVLQALAKYRWSVFLRLELHLVREYSKNCAGRVAKLLGERWLFQNGSVRHEYTLLLRQEFSNLCSVEREAILNWLATGEETEKLRSSLRDWYGREPTAAEIVKARGHRMWKDLFLFRKEDLPTEWREKRDQMVEKYGVPDHPDFLSYHTKYRPPESPVSYWQALEWSGKEFIQFLRGWTPGAQNYEGERTEGLAQVTKRLVATAPLRFTTHWQDLSELDPVLVDAVLSGFESALRDGRSYDWIPVVNLCKSLAVEMLGPTASPSEGRHPGESISTLGRLVDLLLAGVIDDRNSIPLEKRESVWSIVRLLVDRLLSEQSTSAIDNGLEDASFNTVEGKTIELLIQYGGWIQRDSDKPDEPVHALPSEVADALKRLLDRTPDDVQLIHYMVGKNLPWLQTLDPEWVQSNVELVLPTDPKKRAQWWAAFGGFLSGSKPTFTVCDTMLRNYEIAVDQLRVETSANTPSHADKLLAQHLVVRYALGKPGAQPSQALVDRFFESASPALRAHAVKFVALELRYHSGKMNAEIIERLTLLCDARVRVLTGLGADDRIAEATGLIEWLYCTKFPAKWRIEHLTTVFSLGGRPRFGRETMETLVGIAKMDTHGAFDALEALVQYKTEPAMLAANTSQVEQLLEAALSSGDPELNRRAIDLIHRIGAHGSLQFRHLLSQGGSPTNKP